MLSYDILYLVYVVDINWYEIYTKSSIQLFYYYYCIIQPFLCFLALLILLQQCALVTLKQFNHKIFSVQLNDLVSLPSNVVSIIITLYRHLATAATREKCQEGAVI